MQAHYDSDAENVPEDVSEVIASLPHFLTVQGPPVQALQVPDAPTDADEVALLVRKYADRAPRPAVRASREFISH